MEETLTFLAECDRFWEWVEGPNVSVEDLSEFSRTGEIPKLRRGLESEADVEVEPKQDTTTKAKAECRRLARKYSLQCYYQGLTQQFKFSWGTTGSKVYELKTVIKAMENNTLEPLISGLAFAVSPHPLKCHSRFL